MIIRFKVLVTVVLLSCFIFINPYKAGISKETTIDCQQYSLGSEYQFMPLFGKVVTASKEYLSVECFEKNCHDNFPAYFYARLIDQNGKYFRVTTKSITAAELSSMAPYMIKGMSYQFCAREIPVPVEANLSEKVYKIDNTETIVKYSD